MVGKVIDLPQDLRNIDTVAQQIGKLWVDWDTARSTWKDQVREVETYVFATDTAQTANKKNPWSHSTHIPKITQIYDNLTSNYLHAAIPHSDWLQFESFDEDSSDVDVMDKVTGYVRTKLRLQNFYSTTSKLLADWVLKGNCFVKEEYVSDEFGYTGPKATRIDPLDIVFNPLAPTFEASPKIIQSVKTIGDLIQESEDNQWSEEEVAILDMMRKLRSAVTTHGIESIDKFYDITVGGFGSFAQYLQSGFVEVLDFYGDLYDSFNDEYHRNVHIRVYDRSFVGIHAPLDTWDKTPHIYMSGWRTRPNNLWSMGPLDNLLGMQYRINHLENARADAFDQMITGDKVFIGDVEVVENADGSKEYYVMSERGSVSYLIPDTTILNADFQIKSLEDKMEAYAGAPREAMGVRSPGEKTKFEVQSLQTSASRTFQGKINKFERTILEPLINSMIESARQNLTTKDTAQVLDPETGIEEFVDITKDDLLAKGKIVPIGARHYARQAQLLQELSNFHQLALTDPEVAVHFPSKSLAQAWAGLLGETSLYEANGRIAERMEAQQMESSALELNERQAQVDIPEEL